MTKYINPPRLSTSFSKDGKQIKKRFANILDTRTKKKGAVIFILIALTTFIFSGCFASGETINDEALKTDGIINVVISGKDASEKRSDIILLCRLDEEVLSLLQIPRDTRVELSGESKIGRIETTEEILKSVEDITGINCANYIDVKLEGFRNIVDAIGGVDFDVPTDMNYEDPYQQLKINLNSGGQHLNGEQTEALMRYRKDSAGSGSNGYVKGYANGDLDRLSVHKDLYYAIADKILKSDVTPELLKTIKENIDTNLTAGDIAAIAKRALNLKHENIHINILSGTTEKIGMENFYIHDGLTNNKSSADNVSDGDNAQISGPYDGQSNSLGIDISDTNYNRTN